jgi:hypothetical protein
LAQYNVLSKATVSLSYVGRCLICFRAVAHAGRRLNCAWYGRTWYQPLPYVWYKCRVRTTKHSDIRRGVARVS